MTMPAGAQMNWCPACEDTCDDHHGRNICTVCGTELQYPPVARPQQQPTFQASAQDLLGTPDYLHSSQRIQVQSREHADGGVGTSSTAGAAGATGSDIVREILQRARAVREISQRIQDVQDDFPHRQDLTNLFTQQVQQAQELIPGIAFRLEQLLELRHPDHQTQPELQDILEAFTRVQETMGAAQQRLQRLVMSRNSFGNADDGGAGGGRPTSTLYLNMIPRVVLEPNSSILYHSTIKVWTKKSPGSSSSSSTTSCFEFQAIPGEFGAITTDTTTDDPVVVVLEDCRVVIASPDTGKGGVLSEKTCRQINNCYNDDDTIGRDQRKAKRKYSCSSSSCVVYFDRGGDVTFVQKALLAQKAGAQAVVIGNNLAEPWPYTMKDSKSEAIQCGLHIPVVMVKQADAKAILSQATCDHNNDCNLWCRLEIQPNPSECVVCLQALEVGHTILSLPPCGHVFHEACVMTWLHSHNTCPYCRQELPTDDQEYEQEQRRAQRTPAGSTTSAGSPSSATGGGPSGSDTSSIVFFG